VFAGDNGPEPTLLNLGTSGFFDGSLFAGMEGALRTPCIARWPNRIAAGRRTNEIFHLTDWFTTLITMAGLDVPGDRVIDGKDQSSFLYGQQEESNREGFLSWNGARLYGVKWRNFKMALVEQRSMFDSAPDYGTMNCRNLIWDPKETQPLEPLIPAGAPLDFVPKAK